MGGTTVLKKKLDDSFRNRAAIAAAIGVNRSTFHDWEHGHRRVSRPDVRLFLSYLAGAPESELFDEEGRAL